MGGASTATHFKNLFLILGVALATLSLLHWYAFPRVDYSGEVEDMSLMFRGTRPWLIFSQKHGLDETNSYRAYKQVFSLPTSILHHWVYWAGCAKRTALSTTRLLWRRNPEWTKAMVVLLESMALTLEPFIVWPWRW